MSREDHLDKHGQLREAIKKGDKKSAKQLILNNALADNSNRKSSAHSLLHWAIIKFQDTEIVEILLDQKVGINAKNHRRQTPLDLAVQLDKVRAVKLLLSRGAHVGEDLGSLIHSATTNGNDKIVKLLVNYGVANCLLINLNDSLNLAIEKGFAKIVKCIIPHCTFKKKDKKRISKNIVSKVGQQYNECIEILLQHGFSIPPDSEKDDAFVFSAVANGYTSIVRELLLLGINVNMRNEKTGLTLLHAACLNKHLKIAELLVKHKADVNSEVIEGNSSQEVGRLSKKSKSLVGKTALHIVVNNSDAKLTKLLLDSGVKIKDDSNFVTATSIAVKNECKEIVEIFLKHGADINATDADGRTLLHLCTECVSQYSSFLSESRQSRFNSSIKHELAELLLKKGANINAHNKNGETPLFTAIRNEYLKMVQVLLKYNANVNHVDVNGNAPLHITFETHFFDCELLKLLLNHNANVNVANKDGRTPVHLASGDPLRSYSVQLLLDHKADINSTDNLGMTPLHSAANSMDLETMTILLESKASINAKNNNGKTPLHFVCGSHPRIPSDRAKLLLQYNADVHAVDVDGRTPLFYACKIGHLSVVKLLLANKADVNHVDSSGMTPIFIAAENSPKKSKVIKLLLERKSTNVHFVTNEGKMLLHILAEQNRLEIVENYFDRMNIDINLIDKSGKTALHYAAAEGHRQMVVSLLKHGADINVPTEGHFIVLYCTFKRLIRLAKEYNRFLRNPEQSADRASISRMINLYNSKINTCKKILKTLKEHIVKLKCAGLYVRRQNYILTYGEIERNDDSSDDDFSDDDDNDDDGHDGNLKVRPRRFEATCTEEIERLKLQNVGNSHITLHNFLTGNIHSVAKYAKHASIVQDLESNNLREKFPLYIDIIKNRFAEGVRRSKLLETAHKNFSSVIYHRLPYDCVDEIFSYLHIEDLKTFIKTVVPSTKTKKNKSADIKQYYKKIKN